MTNYDDWKFAINTYDECSNKIFVTFKNNNLLIRACRFINISFQQGGFLSYDVPNSLSQTSYPTGDFGFDSLNVGSKSYFIGLNELTEIDNISGIINQYPYGFGFTSNNGGKMTYDPIRNNIWITSGSGGSADLLIFNTNTNIYSIYSGALNPNLSGTWSPSQGIDYSTVTDKIYFSSNLDLIEVDASSNVLPPTNTFNLGNFLDDIVCDELQPVIYAGVCNPTIDVELYRFIVNPWITNTNIEIFPTSGSLISLVKIKGKNSLYCGFTDVVGLNNHGFINEFDSNNLLLSDSIDLGTNILPKDLSKNGEFGGFFKKPVVFLTTNPIDMVDGFKIFSLDFTTNNVEEIVSDSVFGSKGGQSITCAGFFDLTSLGMETINVFGSKNLPPNISIVSCSSDYDSIVEEFDYNGSYMQGIIVRLIEEFILLEQQRISPIKYSDKSITGVICKNVESMTQFETTETVQPVYFVSSFDGRPLNNVGSKLEYDLYPSQSVSFTIYYQAIDRNKFITEEIPLEMQCGKQDPQKCYPIFPPDCLIL